MTDYYIQRDNKEFITITPQEYNFFVTRLTKSTFGAGEIEPSIMKRVYKNLKKDNYEKMKEEDFALYYLMGGSEIE